MNKFLKVLIVLVAIPVTALAALLLTQTVALDSQVYAQNSSLQQRIEKYKTGLSNNPTKGDLERLKLRCDVAQTVLKNVNTRATTAQEKRVNAYDNITKNLNDLVTVLKEKSIETTKLEAEITDFQAKVDQYKTDAESYKQAVADAGELKCTDDPLALKAAIQESRNDLQKLQTEVADIRTYVNNVIKPTLQQIRSDLVTQQAANEGTPAVTAPAQGDTNATQ